MNQAKVWGFLNMDRHALEHSARTAAASLVSIVVARVARLPEYYWAPITTLVVMQSSLGAALDVSWQRIIGTALGALAAVLLAPRFGPDAMVFALAVLVLGPICSALRVGNSAYRFSGITLAVVMLIPRAEPAWRVAIHRTAEVSIGIAVGLLLSAVWPERETAK
jgi:uncharacterized membrane protein YgaE (UPF0421/DUF939 family)